MIYTEDVSIGGTIGINTHTSAGGAVGSSVTSSNSGAVGWGAYTVTGDTTGHSLSNSPCNHACYDARPLINTISTSWIGMVPIVADMEIIVPGKVVELTFNDGTKEKAVCDETDAFSLDGAITICAAKKLMGGSSAYNKFVRSVVKQYQHKLENKRIEAEEKERIERKKAKKAEKRKQYKEKKEAKEREKAIEIQTEAYIRAIKTLEEGIDNG